MTSINSTLEQQVERRDFGLEAAFLAATDNTISSPNTLQRALFPRLSTQDTGLLVQTGSAAGRLEAVFVPVMTGLRSASHIQRLFIIAPDDSLLDDYLYRIGPYLRTLAVSQGVTLTLFIEGENALCRRYAPDGTYSSNQCNHPLDIGIDVVVAQFTRFRSLFFGAGGVHAIPGALEGRSTNIGDFDLRRRDLYYFDDAQSYQPDEFRGFVRLVEFLYAEDMDVLIGTATLPDVYRDDLAFFEDLELDESSFKPGRSLTFIPETTLSFAEEAIALVKRTYFQSSRVGVVCETPQAAAEIYTILSSLYPIGVFAYHSGQSDDLRLLNYAQVRELEKEGEGYLLVTDSRAISNSNLDLNTLITGISSPDMLLRRAGRCNRRGDLEKGQIIVLGAGGYQGRTLYKDRLNAYLNALARNTVESPFNRDFWRSLIA